MTRPLSAAHFKQQQRVAIAAMPLAARLAKLLAQSCSRTLLQLAPASWNVSLDRIEETNFPPTDVYARAIRLESQAGSLTMDLTIDRPATAGVIEAVMGGGGLEAPFDMGERPLSRIETAMLDLLSNRLAGEIAKGLESEYGRPFSHFPEEDRSGGAPIAAERASFRFLINVFGHSGEIRMSMPRNELLQQIKAADTGAEDTEQVLAKQQLQRQVGRSDVPVMVTLGPEMLSVAEVTGLRPGRMIELASTAATPVTLWSGGVAAFEGRLLRAGDRLAISITAPMT